MLQRLPEVSQERVDAVQVIQGVEAVPHDVCRNVSVDNFGALFVVGVVISAEIFEHRPVVLPDGFTVAQFRDHFGLTRKYAVPVLEWLDREGHTVRRGDGRALRSK